MVAEEGQCGDGETRALRQKWLRGSSRNRGHQGRHWSCRPAAVLENHCHQGPQDKVDLVVKDLTELVFEGHGMKKCLKCTNLSPKMPKVENL